MKIGEKEKTFVALSYELTVNGELVEKVTAESPLQFVYGAGFLLPKFEAHLKGLSKGDEFAFHLDTDDAYGPVIGEAVVDLPKEVFMVDGKVEDGLLEIGNQLPMSDNQGNRLVGVVKDVKDDVVTMDFNHPMAGKSLDFKGQVVEVREATPEDLGPMNAGVQLRPFLRIGGGLFFVRLLLLRLLIAAHGGDRS